MGYSSSLLRSMLPQVVISLVLCAAAFACENKFDPMCKAISEWTDFYEEFDYFCSRLSPEEQEERAEGNYMLPEPGMVAFIKTDCAKLCKMCEAEEIDGDEALDNAVESAIDDTVEVDAASAAEDEKKEDEEKKEEDDDEEASEDGDDAPLYGFGVPPEHIKQFEIPAGKRRRTTFGVPNE